jgi:hypothetical protein
MEIRGWFGKALMCFRVTNQDGRLWLDGGGCRASTAFGPHTLCALYLSDGKRLSSAMAL